MTSILVREVYDPQGTFSFLVQSEAPLEEVLRRFAQETCLRSIFVTDSEGRLVGVITRADLLHWARLRLGTALRGVAGEPETVLRLVQLLRASTAGEAIHPESDRAAVRLDDTLDLALQRMLQADLIAIPVVDGEGKVVGDLTFSRVLRYVLDMAG
ncbi:MAG: CBS domain-containing protein [Anaerolineae bacterium]